VTFPRFAQYGDREEAQQVRADTAEGIALLEIKLTKPNGAIWHHVKLNVPQFEAVKTFKEIVAKVRKDYPTSN
jgi:hypothetical protein